MPMLLSPAAVPAHGTPGLHVASLPVTHCLPSRVVYSRDVDQSGMKQFDFREMAAFLRRGKRTVACKG